MGHGKETPRQKMIGMMYLVLTAMLALNVSKEVLDAFVLVDHGLQTTTEAFAAKNASAYDEFAMAYEQNPAKVGDWKNKADEVKKRTDELYDYIQECKLDIIRTKDESAIHEGHIDWHEVKVLDNLETGAQVMITEEGGRRYKELQGQIEGLRDYLLSIIEDHEAYAATVEAIEQNLSTEPPDKLQHGNKKSEMLTWQSGYFEGLPLAAVVTLLSKMQADARNVEAEMINYLRDQVGAGDFRVNVLEAVVVPNSSYVLKGQEYRAEVFLAAYDSTNMPEIILNDGSRLNVKAGKGIYSFTSPNAGFRKWGGTIQIESQGNLITRTFASEYEVAEPTATISATAMNVFYRGVDNPVAISAGGVAESDVDAEISSGHRINRVSPGKYTVKPGVQSDEAIVSVFARVDGGRRLMNRMSFRVKDIPNPNARVEGIRGSEGVLSAGQLAGLQEVLAIADDFLFEVEFTVTSFSIGFTDANGIYVTQDSPNNRFTSQQLSIFRNMRSGQVISISQVKAIGPDGRVRTLNPINIRVR
jgi:gliding motility-associated protein GldM